MKKILLLLAVCTLTTANAARPLTIMNETDNYYIYGHITAKNNDCSKYIEVNSIEFYPGDAVTSNGRNTLVNLIRLRILPAPTYTYNGNDYTQTGAQRELADELFVNGTFEWTNFNFKAVHESNPMLQDGTILSIINDQNCDNNLPHQWTGGNGTSIARGQNFSIGEHMYMNFTEQ